MIRFLLSSLIVMVGVGTASAAQFDHEAHRGYVPDTPCADCHVADAVTVVPDTKVCLNCHEKEFVKEVSIPSTVTHGPVWAFNHRPFAKGNTYDCASCHEQDFCLECHKSGFADEQGDFGNAMMNVHRSDFQVTHPIAARTDPQLCASCHENKFCVECHEDFAPQDLSILSHRRGFRDGTLGGRHVLFSVTDCQACHFVNGTLSVLPSSTGWSREHALEARKNLVTCQACHPEGDVCLRCHSARTGLRVNPHPDGWDDIKGRLKRASDGRTCRKCH